MANIKSAQKQARQSIVRRKRNLARRTALKSAVRSVLDAIKEGKDVESTQVLLRNAQARFARAKGKRVVHANTASRKIGRLAKKVAAAYRTSSTIDTDK